MIRAEHECLGRESCSHHVERVAHKSGITALQELLPKSKGRRLRIRIQQVYRLQSLPVDRSLMLNLFIKYQLYLYTVYITPLDICIRTYLVYDDEVSDLNNKLYRRFLFVLIVTIILC